MRNASAHKNKINCVDEKAARSNILIVSFYPPHFPKL